EEYTVFVFRVVLCNDVGAVEDGSVVSCGLKVLFDNFSAEGFEAADQPVFTSRMLRRIRHTRAKFNLFFDEMIGGVALEFRNFNGFGSWRFCGLWLFLFTG